MSFFQTMNTSVTGLTSQRVRMDIIAQNIANATTTQTAEGGPYLRQAAIFESIPRQHFADQLDEALRQNPLTQGRRQFEQVNNIVERARSNDPDATPGGVRVSQIFTDHTPGPLVYDPAHPHADVDGYVRMPNVNIVYEMVNMISASRSYEANMTAITTTRALIQATLNLGQG
ncbi:MAG: flagellar basal body rod protein FlgC [Defluviitaleaceae bacterium]|nr:flagellar basal body rod protein FlgC [Defluviitaleaceae bacterium]